MRHDSIINILQDLKDLEILQIELKNQSKSFCNIFLKEISSDDEEAENTKEELPWRVSRIKKRFSDIFRKLYVSGFWASKENEKKAQKNLPSVNNNIKVCKAD